MPELLLIIIPGEGLKLTPNFFKISIYNLHSDCHPNFQSPASCHRQNVFLGSLSPLLQPKLPGASLQEWGSYCRPGLTASPTQRLGTPQSRGTFGNSRKSSWTAGLATQDFHRLTPNIPFTHRTRPSPQKPHNAKDFSLTPRTPLHNLDLRDVLLNHISAPIPLDSKS